ncbi:MAG: hypothetical protein HYR72_13830 [Deltaproteobacteria bacterium]|nr:hypothetical protein [Deltaproteobacteria bacterium]MBI3391145.1 hypothetical protein [Deltaproteobacteria bacterium]
MQIAQQFSSYLKEIAQGHGREDLALVERSWDEFAALYSRVVAQVERVLSFASDRQAKPLAQWRRVAEVVAYDLAASKRLLDEGFRVQAPAMLRVAMETGCTLTILGWSNHLSDWLAGDRVEVPWKGMRKGRRLTIDDCTYGELARWLRSLAEQAGASQTDPQLITMIEDLSEVHERFRRTLDANKYIHKSRELVNQTGWLFGQFLEQVQSESKKVEVREGLLDMWFEFHVTFDRCLYHQLTSRFIELCRLIECQGVGLPQSERNGFTALATELMAVGQQFEEALQPHWAAWAARHGEKVN